MGERLSGLRLKLSISDWDDRREGVAYDACELDETNLLGFDDLGW